MPFFLQLFLDQLTKIVKNMHLADKLTLFDSIKPTFVDTSPSDNWPDMGEIRFENLSTYKQPDNISFLQGFSLKIDASKKLFVVGDDDSQIVNSMFRLIEPSGGKILIDDVDLSSINPTRLRRCLSIIPEKPILLSESIRFNLDPLQKTSDDQIWSVLKTVNLDAIISNKWTDGLSHEIDTENDFSAHQIWLLEVARVLLVSSKVLVVEKAIGMIDKLTSDSIVEILAQNVPNSILFMESNLKSTLNYDMPVLWLENGQLRSFDLPSKLISDVPSTSEVKN
jgi:ABC-type multidrug transport system fused ATPase/permease subunit